jgi:hypothetical protein
MDTSSIARSIPSLYFIVLFTGYGPGLVKQDYSISGVSL